MLFAIAVFTSALFRTHDVELKDLEMSYRWLGRSRSASSGRGGTSQPRAEGEEDALDVVEQDPLSQGGLTGESGLLVDATEKDCEYTPSSEELPATR